MMARSRNAALGAQISANLLAGFETARDQLPGAGQPWLESLREAGIGGFAEAGIPHAKVEDWKYTNLNALMKLDFRPADGTAQNFGLDTVPSLLPATSQSYRLVFINGAARPELSKLDGLPPGVRVSSLGELFRRGEPGLADCLGALGDTASQPFLALNTAMMEDGYVLRLDDGAHLDKPLEIVQIAAANAAPILYHPRNLVVAGEGSRATIIEHHLSLPGGVYCANGVSELKLGAGAEINLYKAQCEAAQAFHFHQAIAQLADDACFTSFALMLGGRLARNETHVTLGGQGASCHVNGVYALKAAQHSDNLTRIDHVGVETTSRQTFKGVLDDASRAVFQGKIRVAPGAQRSDGQQLNKTLLLSDKSEIDTKPELEIHADDVKCGHGATAGELSEDAVFYLRSRGIPELEAHDLLVGAFLEEAIAEIADDAIAAAFRDLIGEWLSAREPGVGP